MGLLPLRHACSCPLPPPPVFRGAPLRAVCDAATLGSRTYTASFSTSPTAGLHPASRAPSPKSLPLTPPGEYQALF